MFQKKWDEFFYVHVAYLFINVLMIFSHKELLLFWGSLCMTIVAFGHYIVHARNLSFRLDNTFHLLLVLFVLLPFLVLDLPNVFALPYSFIYNIFFSIVILYTLVQAHKKGFLYEKVPALESVYHYEFESGKISVQYDPEQKKYKLKTGSPILLEKEELENFQKDFSKQMFKK